MTRKVARPRSAVENSRAVILYDAQLVTTIARPDTSASHAVKEVSGPSGPRRPRSMVCCTATGTTTWPTEAITASVRVQPMPSASSGEWRTPRRIVSQAPISSPLARRVCSGARRVVLIG